MLRRIIKIDRDQCDGCGLCADACHEGAIGIRDGKAVLLREDYCDGLGDCLPVCPMGAIRFEEREAPAYDEAAVKRNLELQTKHPEDRKIAKPTAEITTDKPEVSQLRNWPIQIKLASTRAPWLNDADILVSADCAAYACGDFHSRFMRDKVTLIGCPKLDGEDYSEKLSAILASSGVKSVTVARMEVPCCGGLERAVMTALENRGAALPCRVVTISAEGQVVDEREEGTPC